MFLRITRSKKEDTMRTFNIVSLFFAALLVMACATTSTDNVGDKITKECPVAKRVPVWQWDFTFVIMHGQDGQPAEVLLYLMNRNGEACLRFLLVDECGIDGCVIFVDDIPSTASQGRIPFHKIVIDGQGAAVEGRILQCFFTVDVALDHDGTYRKVSSPKPRPGYEKKCQPLLTVE